MTQASAAWAMPDDPAGTPRQRDMVDGTSGATLAPGGGTVVAPPAFPRIHRMNARRASTLLALAVAWSATSVASSQDSKLKVGDQAPAITVAEWIQGDVTGLENGKVNLVEFWATWCGPCKKSIPHLNRLYSDHAAKGLVIIGISDEKPEVVTPFVKQRGSAMSYPVGVDSNEQTKQAWSKAAGQEGIPHAFLVSRDGKIVWIGHPMDDELERILPKALAGKYDPILEKRAKPLLEAAERAARQRNYREAYGHLDKVIDMDPRIFSGVVLERYELMLTGEKNQQAAHDYLAAKVQSYSTDPATLAEIATALVNDPALTPRDLPLASEAADLMMTSGPDRPESLAVLAMVQFADGKVDDAVENQQQAWMLAAPNEKATYRRVLDNYRGAAGRRAGTVSPAP